MDTSADYWLCQDAYFGVSERFVAFLSLSQDRYHCVQSETLVRAAALLHGWPDGSRAGRADAAAHRLCETLAVRGLLTRSALDGKPVRPTIVARASGDLGLESWAPRGRVFLGRGRKPFGRMARALLRAEVDLRTRTLAETTRRTRGSPASSPVADDVRQRVEEFQSLRPLYGRPYRCLFDSLALLYFLQDFGFRATWVFGVRPEPFAAHCWLQLGETVLNDACDRVIAHTPVLAV